MEEPFKASKLETQLPNTVKDCHDFIGGLLNTISELFKRIETLE
jgi:hypothetical protein